LGVVVVVSRSKEGKVHSAARGCGFSKKVNVREEAAASARGDRGRVGPGAFPVNVAAIVADAKVVCPPVDEGIGLGQPWFAQNEVIFLQGVDNGGEGCGVFLSLEGNVGEVGGEGS
jgi:hypothetical protein